ncbi:urokinase plasminogen activator surface receptor-like [Sinocyclocheilus rhinocerous]|uniref:urokinase plasminogen activator surface receptor-like n=1 Tax=Sinocyclocheilus rhinocerous TaxID=307959 RepID=UPI0007B84760|nr:PREDICTED: urokinase plasminogen activator surface receptor-like [Sinocyclocheilus rhinocerous]
MSQWILQVHEFNSSNTNCGFSKCMSSTAVTQIGEISSQVSIKNCAVDCQNGSMNFGFVKTSYSCCDTDLCNAKDAPDLSSIVPNGKTCYSCDGHSCLNITSCSGIEDRCIKATESFGGQSTVVKGCVSKSICDATTSVSSVNGISCCSGNLCNGAQSVTQSFLFLCCSLLSFILLH